MHRGFAGRSAGWAPTVMPGRAADDGRAPRAPGAARPLGGYATSGMIRIATMFATLIIGLIAGPDVSL